ncbi:hypothetical protein Syun_020110 [Stephania yunnanensis]|uniref:Bifunctional inhibitor/plant lipid transfer protein/seed storage helical domain-containing protein n=1 Tax=Stephania yunnanensis TaxID=152371 RepID=A0AAP0IDX5_9MAGN
MEKMKVWWKWRCLGVMVLVLATLSYKCESQEDMSCVRQLSPCLKYLKGSGEPPSSCCDPLKSMIESNPRCLCSMVSRRGSSAAEQAGINMTAAQELPGRCGQNVNPIACLAGNNNRGATVPSSAASRPSVELTVMLLSVALPAMFHILCTINSS